MSSLGKLFASDSGRAAIVAAAAVLLLFAIGSNSGLLTGVLANAGNLARTSAQDVPQLKEPTGTTPVITTENIPDPPAGELPPANVVVPATNIPTEQPAVPFEFTDDTFGTLQSDPDSFAGSNVTITGQVYSVLDQSSPGFYMMTLKVFNKAEIADESRAVILLAHPPKGGAKPVVGIEDCIAIDGKVRGGINEEGSLGGTIRVPLIDTAKVTMMECIDSALPASRTVDASISQSLNGIMLTAQKVQFAEDHTRIEIKAENLEGGDSVVIKEAVAMQGGESYLSTTQAPAFASYRLPSKLAAESPATGYLFFEPVGDPHGEVVFRIIVEEVTVSETTESTFIFTVK